MRVAEETPAPTAVLAERAAEPTGKVSHKGGIIDRYLKKHPEVDREELIEVLTKSIPESDRRLIQFFKHAASLARAAQWKKYLESVAKDHPTEILSRAAESTGRGFDRFLNTHPEVSREELYKIFGGELRKQSPRAFTKFLFSVFRRNKKTQMTEKEWEVVYDMYRGNIEAQN